MSEEKRSSGMAKVLVLGIIVGIALVVASFVLAGGFGKIANGFGTLANGFGSIAKPDRIVTVRGLAEREVDADMAIWPMTISIGANSLSDLQKDLVSKIDVTTAFLKSFGLQPEDYTVQAPEITDNSLIMSYNDKPTYRYIAKQKIMIRSKNVKAVKTAQEHSLDLTANNIAVLQEYDSRIMFEYTALNSIKPEMIGEATKNARAAAEQFASDSGSAVGKIRTATQGWFSIEDAETGLEEKKKVRVVTTVEYILTD